MTIAAPAQTPGLRPRRRLRRPMVLTPLVDIVFLLLTFFMLSSQLTPFSLLTLTGQKQASAAVPSDAGADADADAGTRRNALLSVGAGQVKLNGKRIGSGELLSALRSEVAAGTTRLTLLVKVDATVQDFVAALEATKLAAFPSISIADVR